MASAATSATKNECHRKDPAISNLKKLPNKEFERQFREWMNSDGVARSLQAKLRYDLVTSFNQTALGKKIIAYTTNTINRLTLSPIVLALNTLVAEFLYAQNCTFSLSVFCTEVPYRNTLPDFDSQRFFRFSEAEIIDILQAVSDQLGNDYKWKKKITQNYLANTQVSLLYLLLKALLERIADVERKTATVGVNTHAETPPATARAQADRTDDIHNMNIRYLNKYLIILSKKVKEMSRQFEGLRQQRCLDAQNQSRARFQVRKTSSMRRYENLNRSLERITSNLRQMSSAKRKSKQISIILESIEGLSEQFARCAANFESVSKKLISTKRRECLQQPASVRFQGHPKECAQTETQTEHCEKSYMDWIHEMRYTENGQKFLDRIEQALKKALDKQKHQIEKEMEVKLLHQKELLKIHYKQKLLQELSKHTDLSEVAHRTHGDIEKQLKVFEAKHTELLNKLSEVEEERTKWTKAQTTAVSKQHDLLKSASKQATTQSFASKDADKLKLSPKSKLRKQSLAHDARNARQQLQHVELNVAEQSRNLEQIVYNARSRMQELENESKQLDKNFQDYLERKRLTAEFMWHDYVSERDKLRATYFEACTELPMAQNEVNAESDSTLTTNRTSKESNGRDDKAFAVTKLRTRERLEKTARTDVEPSLSDVEFRNAIEEAKQKFFEQDRLAKEKAERLIQSTAKAKIFDWANDAEDSEGEAFNLAPIAAASLPHITHTLVYSDGDGSSDFAAHPMRRGDAKRRLSDGAMPCTMPAVSHLTLPSTSTLQTNYAMTSSITTTASTSAAASPTFKNATTYGLEQHGKAVTRIAMNALSAKETIRSESASKFKRQLLSSDVPANKNSPNTHTMTSAQRKNNKDKGKDNANDTQLTGCRENHAHQINGGSRGDEHESQPSAGPHKRQQLSAIDFNKARRNDIELDDEDVKGNGNGHGGAKSQMHAVAGDKGGSAKPSVTTVVRMGAVVTKTSSVLQQSMEKMRWLFESPGNSNEAFDVAQEHKSAARNKEQQRVGVQSLSHNKTDAAKDIHEGKVTPEAGGDSSAVSSANDNAANVNKVDSEYQQGNQSHVNSAAQVHAAAAVTPIAERHQIKESRIEQFDNLQGTQDVAKVSPSSAHSSADERAIEVDSVNESIQEELESDEKEANGNEDNQLATTTTLSAGPNGLALGAMESSAQWRNLQSVGSLQPQQSQPQQQHQSPKDSPPQQLLQTTLLSIIKVSSSSSSSSADLQLSAGGLRGQRSRHAHHDDADKSVESGSDFWN